MPMCRPHTARPVLCRYSPARNDCNKTRRGGNSVPPVRLHLSGLWPRGWGRAPDRRPDLKDRLPRLFQMCEASNFIEATPEAPFLHIGQFKYGKPILDRIVHHNMSPTGLTKEAL